MTDQLDRVGIASRVFCLAAVLGLIGLTGAPGTMSTLLIVAIAGSTAIYVTVATPLSSVWVISAEGLTVGLLIGTGLPESQLLFPYLVGLSLIAGLAQGVMSVAAVTLSQIVAVVVLPSAFHGGTELDESIAMLAPWLLTAVGMGLLGAWIHRTRRTSTVVGIDPSYEAARRLLTQLRTVVRRLSAGLDSYSMASQLLSVVHEHLQDTQSAVFVHTDGDVFTPISYRGPEARETLFLADAALADTRTQMEPTFHMVAGGRADRRRCTVLPLRVGARMLGYVISASNSEPDAATLAQLMRAVDEHSMRIDTALAFDEVRAMATADERRRVAREIHDGIAQEIASLGYVVDEMAARSSDADSVRDLHSLRGELTRVVNELRLSIFELRSEIVPGAGLGATLTDYVRQIGARSNMKVHISLDEAGTRLTAGVEAELFRIAQEAITNARKHSRARNLWVECRVQPPYARIDITDDGCGIELSGENSFGLRIMEERANRIDATLDVGTNPNPGPNPGTIVTVEMNKPSVETALDALV